MIITDFFYGIHSADAMLNQEDMDLSFIIKTFRRPDNLTRLLLSLRRLNCKAPIIIGDDSPEPYRNQILSQFPDLNIQYLLLPFDTGLSEGRNLMLKEVVTTYFVLCDDDFIFDKRSRVMWMKQQLIQNELDILGGVFYEYRPKTKWEWRWRNFRYKLILKNFVIPPSFVYNYYGNYEVSGSTCRITQPQYAGNITNCDFCHNFFIGHVQRVQATGGWNKALKVGEHEHFFFQAKLKGLKVATTQHAGIIHGNFYDADKNYSAFRNRSQSLQANSLKEFGIEKVDNYENTIGFNFGNAS